MHSYLYLCFIFKQRMKFSLFIALIFFSCSKKYEDKSSFSFKGSNTSNEVVSEMARCFNSNTGKKIKVMGGGSEQAIKEFISGDLYYLNSSRKLTKNEISKVEALQDKKVKELIIGLDAIAIIVNPKLGVHELSLTQISNIFEGKTRNWQDLGGPNLMIRIYGRNKASGTCHFMKDKFAPNGFGSSIVEKNNSKEIIKAIKSDLAGISYVDLSSISNEEHFPISGIWAMNISIDGEVSVSPFERIAVLSGNYPISRPLYQYVVDFENPVINSFLKYELSPEGQNLMEKYGFFKILPIHESLNRENGFSR
jgi:phosphate transport system substrate-binding protein